MKHIHCSNQYKSINNGIGTQYLTIVKKTYERSNFKATNAEDSSKNVSAFFKICLRNKLILNPLCQILFIQLIKSLRLWRVRFFFSEPSAAGGYNWLPAPLGCNSANAGNTKQWRTTVTESSFFFMMIYYQSQSRIHRSTITTVARPQLTGSGEPVTRAK